MQFLLDRFAGKPFKFCTGWSEVMKSEKKVNKWKKKLKSFRYI
jgi:hypothetical protein